jgi:glycosyltransferase involved in cell wall biosynthesis
LWPGGNVRVLHTIAPGPVGGAESVVLGLSAGLAEAGAEVVLAILADLESGPFIEQARAEGRQVEVLPSAGRNYWRDRSLLKQVVRNHRINLVHTHGYRADIMGFLAARSERCPVVATAHGFTGGGRRNRLNQWLAVRALSRDDCVVAVSAPLAAQLQLMGVPAERIATIPNAWRPPSTGPVGRAGARAALGLEGDGPMLGWVGRLSYVKGADVALDALALMRNRQVRLVFVGDGPERATLEAQVTKLGLGGQVRFVGMVKAASSLLNAFDAVVLSSRSEGTPMILLEAIHAGVPIVATAVGGVPDLITPATGTLVPPNDPAALAAAMDEALSHPGAAHARALAARIRVADRYSPEAWVSRHLAVYQRVMERHPH